MTQVLYIGELWNGGTCLERAKVLGEHGWQIVQFDVTPYIRSSNRVLAGLQHRLLWGPDIERLNRDVITAARNTGPIGVVWVDKGRWLHASTLRKR
ncbi:MAG: hypothetical protein Kow00128_16010 [Deltaproteobacteria bacterium]